MFGTATVVALDRSGCVDCTSLYDLSTDRVILALVVMMALVDVYRVQIPSF